MMIKRYRLSLKDGVTEASQGFYPATTSMPMVLASDYDRLEMAARAIVECENLGMYSLREPMVKALKEALEGK